MGNTVRVAVCGWFVGWAAVARGEPAPDRPTAELVLDLGSSSYSAREAAGRELWLRGRAAHAAVAAAAAGADPEAARRARDLLGRFDWGIFPDTPPAVVTQIVEFRSGDPPRRANAVAALVALGRPGADALRSCLARATPADVPAALIEKDDSAWRQLSDHVAQTVRRDVVLRLVDRRLDDADALIGLNALGASPAGLADLAAYHYLRGTLPAAVARAEAARAAGGPQGDVARVVLAHLYRAQGAWAKARTAAADLPRRPGEPPLFDMLLEEEGAWAELARRTPAAANLPDGLKLTYLRLAGRTADYDALAARVKADATDGAGYYEVRKSAESLLLAGKPAEATDLLLDKRQNLGLLSELLIARMRFQDALQLVGGASDQLPPQERSDFDLRRARVLCQLGKRDAAVQLFGEVADGLRGNPEGGRGSLHETGVTMRSLLRAEVRLGLRDLACEHAAAFLTADDSRVKSLTKFGESPYEILFDADAAAAEALFFDLREKRGDSTPPGPLLRTVRDLFAGTAPPGEVEAAVALLRAKKAAGGPIRFSDTTTRTDDPPHVDRMLALAAVLRGAKRWGECEAALVAAAEAAIPIHSSAERYGGTGHRSWVFGTSDNARPWVELGDFLLDRGRYHEAATRLEAGWKRFPDQPLLLYLCGRAREKAGDAEEGRRRIELAHWVSLGHERLRGKFLEELIRRGAAAAAKRETELLLRACWSRDGYFGNVMNQAARAAALNKDFAAAGLCATRSMLVVMKSPGVHFVEASSYLAVPQNVAVYRARALLAEGRVDDALSAADAVLAAQPGHVELTIGLVPGLERAGRGGDADALFARVWAAYGGMLKAYPDSPSARNSAAWLAANCRRELDRALEYATAAVAADPKSVSYRETLAEVHFRRGDRDKALSLMAALADEQPRSRLFRRQLGRYRDGDPASPIPDTE